MVLRWVTRNLVQEPGALAASVGGIAMSLLVVLLVEGMFAGESARIAAYLDHAGADVWVMQKGVSNMHMATSLVRGDVVRAVAAVPGVAATTPILNESAFLGSGGGHWYSYAIGLRPDAAQGGPWTMVRGKRIPGVGEAIVPDVIARKAHVAIGDSIGMLGRDFTITGISRDTYSMANSLTFVAYEDLARLLSVRDDAASYIIVRTVPGVPPADVAERIRRTVPDVNAMVRRDAVDSDRGMAMQMGVDIIGITTWIGGFAAALVVALTAYSGTMRRTRELGVVKALGFRNATLYAAVLVHSGGVAALGYALAGAVAWGIRPVITTVAPEVALLYSPTSLLRLAAATLVVALTASIVPGYRVARIDPAIAFQE
jgi:putative ABC transport system permease protein